MRDNNPYDIISTESAQIRIHEVRHIPNMSKNLIPLSTLEGKGYKYFGGDEVLNVPKCSLIVIEGELKISKFITSSWY